jgi:hypothetical protein
MSALTSSGARHPKDSMHFNFDFSAVQILWTLTFAALLVLLVVLQGRERIRRFPWFTASIILVTLRLLTNRLLHGRLPQLTMAATFIVMADLSALVGLLVVGEVARQAFGRAQRRTWIVWGLVLLAAAGCVVAFWGKWPEWKTLAVDTALARLGLLQLLAQKTGLLVDVLNIGLGLLVVVFGWRYGAGWRSHVQQIAIGLSTASLSQIAVQAVWETMVRTAGVPHSQEDYLRMVGLQDKLFNANSAVYVAVVIWWIVCLWFDEPGSAQRAEAAALAAAAPSAENSSTTADVPEAQE